MDVTNTNLANTFKTATVLNLFFQPSTKLISHHKTGNYLYSTNDVANISINKQHIAELLDSTQFNPTQSDMGDFHSIVHTHFANSATITKKHLIELLIENINQSVLDCSNAITCISIDSHSKELTIETYTRMCDIHSQYNSEIPNGEIASYYLNQENGDSILNAFIANTCSHAYIKTTELAKILSLFANRDNLTISFNDSSSRIKFHDDTTQVITVPYKTHNPLEVN